MRSKIKLDELSSLFILALVLAQNFLPNGFYLFISIATGLLLFNWLSQPYKPAVFTIIAFNHVLQIISGVWLANYMGKDINYRSFYTDRATVLSLIGLFFLFAPVIYQQNKLRNISLHTFRMYAMKFSTQKSLNCYLIALAVTSTLSGLAFVFSGLTQVILSVVKIKWFFFLLFGYQAIIKKERLSIFYLLIAFEFASGFYSFFSDFKTVIYYLGVLLVSFVATINFRQLVLACLLGVGLAYMGLIWTSVKTDYRSFLNRGNRSQNVTVSKDEAIDKLISLSSDVNKEGTEAAAADLLDRLQYTFHFAKALERVPDVVPFQQGANWLNNIEYATTPRFLNPDKPTIDNSVKATKYTGIRYATAKQGTSFSLGYFAEFYVDFGSYLMMPMIFLVGFIYSRIYKYFLTKPSDNPVFNYAIAGAFFFEFYAFEMDGTYFVGRFFASLLTFYSLSFFFSKSLLRYIKAADKKEKPHQLKAQQP
ncbi:MAG: hypothetical protein IPP72_19015 [Chitinophagaceae bacterium]|nr:hypothetical protein [Chitinophagaceae bacterium]